MAYPNAAFEAASKMELISRNLGIGVGIEMFVDSDSDRDSTNSTFREGF